MTISIRSAVERLIDAHSGSRPLAPLSETDGEFTLEQAYAIQDALRAELARRGHNPIGWKLGATSPSGQAVMGVKEPACGFLMSRQYDSGSDVSAREFINLGVEAEVAFKMRTRLTGPGVTADTALRAIDGAVAALELPDFIFAGKPRVSDFVASSVIAKAIVLGSSFMSLSAFDMSREQVVFEHNDETVGTYTSAEVMGDPLTARGESDHAEHVAANEQSESPPPTRDRSGALGLVRVAWNSAKSHDRVSQSTKHGRRRP